MSKFIKINPNDDTFAKLMRDIAKAIRTGDEKLTEKVKIEFADADISLFYNTERDEIRVLRKDCPAIDFPVSQFTELVKAQQSTK
jgi:hypothetical protein